MANPKWLEKKSTRAVSDKQEKRIVKKYGGKQTVNSGATFGQNDIILRDAEIEAKITSKDSFALSVSMWDRVVQKTGKGKMPVLMVEFSKHNQSLVVIDELDFRRLCEKTK